MFKRSCLPRCFSFRRSDRWLSRRLALLPALPAQKLTLAVMRLAPHEEFPNGFPTFEIEEFDALYEGMDVATCGFPNGNRLYEEPGTVTSSFTRGIISSII